MFKQLLTTLRNVSDTSIFRTQTVRCIYHYRGKRPEEAKSLAQYLEEKNQVDPIVDERINIGLSAPKKKKKDEALKQTVHLKAIKNNAALEKASRLGTLSVDADDVRREWIKRDAPQHIQMAAEHYGIYDDLFRDAYFTPYVDLNVSFKQPDGKSAPVHRGNVVKPIESSSSPEVTFYSDPNDLWTLILTNPDGNLTAENKECVHWFIGNIPGNKINKGEIIRDYLQPFPPLGVGFQRFIFILYKQDKRIDFTSLKTESPCIDLEKRSFATRDFYEAHQDNITPAGLAFFQSDWDPSVRVVFHEVLQMEEPTFEYDFTPLYIKPSTWFTKKKPFNMYLDKYRDPQDIAKDFLLKKLENLNPFERPKRQFPYQNIYKEDRRKTPSWLLTEQRRIKLGLGRINQQKDD